MYVVAKKEKKSTFFFWFFWINVSNHAKKNAPNQADNISIFHVYYRKWDYPYFLKTDLQAISQQQKISKIDGKNLWNTCSAHIKWLQNE